MKKIITLTALIIIVFSLLNTNAQPPWARAYGHEKHNKDRRDDRREGNYREERYGNYRDNRRGDYREDYRRDYRAPERRGYYYYPRANVYYNPIGHNYYYPRNGAWISVNVLPRDIYLDQQYEEVYCNEGEDIWRNNYSNIDYYKPAPRPVVVVQPVRPRVSVGINIGARF